MVDRLIGTTSIIPDWAACLSTSPGAGELRSVPANLTLNLENGKSVISQLPLSFPEPATSFARKQTPDWLRSDQEKRSQAADHEERIFDAAWELASRVHKLAKSRSIFEINQAKPLLATLTSIKIFSDFAASATYEQGFSYARIIVLPGVPKALLFAGAVWSVDSASNISDAAKYLGKNYDPLTGEARSSFARDFDRSGSLRRPIPESVRHEVWRRDAGRCVQCGSQERLEFDHVVPLSRGGADTTRNLQLLCEPCNRRKSAKI